MPTVAEKRSNYRIVPAEGGRWVILRDDGALVLGDRDFPSREVAEEALRSDVGSLGVSSSPHQATLHRMDGRHSCRAVHPRFVDRDPPRFARGAIIDGVTSRRRN